MDQQRPDPEHAPSPPQEARVEDDFVRPLTPVRHASRRRLPAALPFAIASILVVTSVAFGAAFIRPIAGMQKAVETPVIISDNGPDESDAPTLGPTLHPTAEVTAPATERTAEPTREPAHDPTAGPTEPAAPGSLTLTAAVVEGKVRLAWSRYAGEDFAYYKVVRSSDAVVSWPADADDTLVAAIASRDQLTVTDCAPKARTYSYRVFAVRSSDAGYVSLAASPVRTVVLPGDPAPTQKPGGPQNLGALIITKNSNGSYTFSWHAYTGDGFTYYKLVHGEWGSAPSYPAFPYWLASGDRNLTSWTGSIEKGDYAVRLQVVDYSSGEPVIKAQTNIVRLVVTGEKPAPAPTVDLGPITVKKNTDGTYTLSWKAYTGPIDFDYYKLDGEPAGTEPGYTHTGRYWACVDRTATSWTGTIEPGSWWIRVQAVYYPDGAAAAGQTQILKLTVEGATPKPTTKPSPVAIGLTAAFDGGKVHLSWGAYTGEGFQYYKVVRSETNAAPTYPENAGTSLRAAITDRGQLSWTDGDVAPGHTYHYRVVVYTFECGGLVLGISPVRTVTIPAAEPTTAV